MLFDRNLSEHALNAVNEQLQALHAHPVELVVCDFLKKAGYDYAAQQLLP